MSTYNEMKKKAESDQNRIELRSEKVRNMIGEMPSFLIRWGNTILVVIFVLLALIAWFVIFLRNECRNIFCFSYLRILKFTYMVTRYTLVTAIS